MSNDELDGPTPQLIWPKALAERRAPPQLCYLDILHWIGLAKALVGHSDGRAYVDCLQACREARSEGRFLFPLSDVHYMEMSKIGNPSQRQKLSAVMEELSGFTTMLSGPTIMRLEIDAALSRIAQRELGSDNARPLLGFGIAWIFGRVGLRIRNKESNADDTDRFIEESPRLFQEIREQFERGVLSGPGDGEEDLLRSLGWNPVAADEVAQRRAEQERDQAERLDEEDRWRRGRLRDVMLGREMVVEMFDAVNDAFVEYNIDKDEVFGSRENARSFVRSMPSREISTELKRAAHRNRQSSWTSNDIFDIDAMSLAVPYCDVVATERNRSHVLRAAGLDDRMSTVIVHRPADLCSVLTAGE